MEKFYIVELYPTKNLQSIYLRPEHGSYCKYTIAQAEEYLNGLEIPENIFKKRNSDKRGDYGYVYYDESHYEQPCYCIDINFTFRFRS